MSFDFESTKEAIAWAEARFSDARAGRLSKDERAEFDRLLDEHASLREGFASFGEAVGVLSSIRPTPVGDDFVAAVRERVGSIAAAPSAPPAGKRTSLFVAWAVAAAAITLACVAWLYRPAPERVEVPVVKRVVVRVPVEQPPVAPVAPVVPVAAPQLVRVAAGSVAVMRDGEVVRVGSGDVLEIRPGDVLRGGETTSVKVGFDFARLSSVLEGWLDLLRERLRTPPMRVDMAPVAKALDRATDSVSALVSRSKKTRDTRPTSASVPAVAKSSETKVAPPWPKDLVKRRLVSSPVELVREPNGVLFIEVTGRDDEVIEELLTLARDGRADVAALALDTLGEIQRRLAREHGIGAPPASVPGTGPSRVRGLARLFSKSAPTTEEPTPLERWDAWWDQHRDRIRRLAKDRAD